ncbi:unnamed protein product [Bemisia tabaci]|uniref:Uncharacterized protein n=1 Tax=Bemisia tabaci TaxID=7038 RepID=A0A9P0AIF3_BEMTA|nr:unnamed protein product [Bemisia tabaci]
MGPLWVAGLVIVSVLSGPCLCDSSTTPSSTNATTAATISKSKPNDTAIETSTDIDEYELLPEAASLTGDQEWIDGPDDGSEDEIIEEDADDIETAGSEVVSTVVKQDETGNGEEEPGMRRRRKKGRKRRRRMRKRPRTTTPNSAEADAYPTPPPSASEEPEKVPVAAQEEQSETYPRRRPGKRRRRPWARPSTEAPVDTPEIQDPQVPQEQQPPVLEEASEEPQTPAPRPRRRKRPKNRTKIPIENINSQETTEAPKNENARGLPENHKQYDGDDLKPGKQAVQKPAPTKATVQYPLEQRPINVEQRPKENTLEPKPKEHHEQRIKVYPVEQKPKDYLSGEQLHRDYISGGQKQKEYATEQRPRDFPAPEQKPKENTNVEQKFKDYQNFGPTNRPISGKQQPQQQTPKHPEVDKVREPGPVFQNIPFRPIGYDGFQQYQKFYGNDPGINGTQQNRQKQQEQLKVQTEKALKPTGSSPLKIQDNTDERYQQSTTKVPPKFLNTNSNSFGNQPPPSKVPEISNSGYGPGYGPPKPNHGSFSQGQKEGKPDQERPSGFQSHQKPLFNVQQGPVQNSKPKPIGTKDTEPQSTTYKPSGFPHKLHNENLLSHNRPENNQYQKPPPGYQANQNFHDNSHRPKGPPPNLSSEGFHKSIKPDGFNAPPLVNSRVPSVPQQNILKQIASQNHQFPAHASVIVSDLETNSAKPQYNDLDDLHSKFRPQSIEQFNHQLVDPTLLTSPVLFEPPVPPVFEDEVQATKLPVSKVQLPPIQYPKAKFPPAPFLPSSQKQLPNTQFQRQAEPAPFRLPQKPELPLTPITLPTQSTHQQSFANQKKAPPQPPSAPTHEKGKQSIHVPSLENNEEKPFVPTNVQQTTTTESETVGYVDVQTTKAPAADTTTRKTPFNHSKRLPPTSAVIRKRVRPRPSKNTTETVPTQESDNKENLSEKYRGGARGKNTYRQHLTEIKPTPQTPDQSEIEQSENYESEPGHKSLSAYGNDGVFTNYEGEETTKAKQNKARYTTSFPESIIEETTPKPGRFGLHHVSAQQEILRQTLQKQSKDTVRAEESTDVPFIPNKSPADEIELDDSHYESVPQPVLPSSKKPHSFTPRKRQRTRGPDTILVTTSTTPKISQLEIITDRPKYSTADEYEFMVSDEELLKMMKPMMGDDFTDQQDTQELRFKAANIHGVKDEILDLIKTDSGSARLSRILRLRNMSLDDLIKHRERGSSQLHLSEIFTHRQHLEPTIQPGPPEIFSASNFGKNSEDDVAAQITPIFESNYIKSKGETDQTRATVSLTEIKTFEGSNANDKDNNREPKVFESMPSFTLRTDILEQINEKKENPPKTDSSWRFFGQVNKPQRPYEDVVISYTSTNRYPYRKPSVEEIDDIILLSDTEQYDAPRSNVIHAKVLADSGGERRDQEFFNETKKLSTGVKSAILVSGAIIGIAVLGFFALMISCRIKQKKARLRAQRDILCDHFHEELRSSARSTSPVMPPGMEENTCEHGVRSTAIPTRHYNNRHYYLWRTLRKTFQYE